MKVIFLAAGRGLRMGALTAALPKAMLALPDGRSILETNIASAAASASIGSILVVGGYCWEQLRDFCAGCAPSPEVGAVRNEAFATAGPARSIEVGLDHLEKVTQSVAIANGDTVFSADLFRHASAATDGIHLVVSHDDGIEPDDMGVTLAADGSVAAAAKSGEAQRRGLVSAGLIIAKGAGAVAALGQAAAAIVQDERLHGAFRPWHDVAARLAGSPFRVGTIEVPRTWWREFDYEECLTAYRSSAVQPEAGPVRPSGEAP